MKKLFIGILMVRSFFIAWKKDEIKLKDIRQTDEFGNVISNGNPTEWGTNGGEDIVNNHFGTKIMVPIYMIIIIFLPIFVRIIQ
jgi:hypothetical protein